MKKLKSIIHYECSTSIKYVGIFYAIVFSVVILLHFVAKRNNGIASELEINTMIYVGILGILGFKEDFKMLIQHGFTRKYIFSATIALFCFISGVMAIVDTVAGNLLHDFTYSYTSLYGNIYGYGNIYSNFLFLFMLYMLICSFAYLIVLTGNKIGKTKSLYASIIFGAVIVVIGALYTNYIPKDLISKISEILMIAMGFSIDGTINCFVPIFTLLVLTCAASLGSYLLICHTELK